MYLTEQEIMQQHIALRKTFEYMCQKKKTIEAFFEKHNLKKFVFLGSGSSYMLSKSGQRIFTACPDTAAAAISGGDYLLHPSYYEETVKNSIIVTLSRSGQTSEIVRDVKYIKETYGCPVISLSMKDENDIMPYSDLDLTMDWCYDKSVCQTRTVTNLYLAVLLLGAFYNHDKELEAAALEAVKQNEGFKDTYRPVLKEIAAGNWDNAVILADGALTGIAEEGALAFTEISMLTGKHFNLLDYRHGPIVLNDEHTLTIAIVSPEAQELQVSMIADIKKCNGTVVIISEEKENRFDTQAHISIEGINRFEAWGIPAIYIMQMISYEKSLLLGRNPDAPTGLDAFITLA